MQPAKHSDLIERTNRAGIDFLFTDLEMAFTFLHVAETSTSSQARERNLVKAQEGYRTVLHFLPRVVPSPIQSAELHEMLEKLKHRLEEAGLPS
jgi:hypothetical protein